MGLTWGDSKYVKFGAEDAKYGEKSAKAGEQLKYTASSSVAVNLVLSFLLLFFTSIFTLL